MATSRATGIRRLGYLFVDADEAAFVLDRARRVVYVNPAWERLTGHAAAAVVGQECRAPGSACADALGELLAELGPPAEVMEGEPAATTSRLRHESGRRESRRVDFWPFRNAKGEMLGILGLIPREEAGQRLAASPSQALHAQLAALRETWREESAAASLVGRGAAHERLVRQIEAAGLCRFPVLVVGPTGSGKREVARRIHDRGQPGSGDWVELDASALSAEHLAADFELLLRGKETASGGPLTVVVREALELPRDLQRELVGLCAPGGAAEGVRLIGTTRGDPEAALQADRIRGDFYYWLTGMVIRLEGLKDRRGEIPVLAQHFVEKGNRVTGGSRMGLDAGALDVLDRYDWPGNVAELARVVAWAHARARGLLIGAEDLPVEIRGHLASAYNPPAMPPPVTPLDATLEQVERRLIEQALIWARHNKSRAAEVLAISRPRLYRRMKELGVPDLGEGDEAVAAGTGGTV